MRRCVLRVPRRIAYSQLVHHKTSLTAKFIGPTWGLLGPVGPRLTHVGPLNLAIRDVSCALLRCTEWHHPLFTQQPQFPNRAVTWWVGWLSRHYKAAKILINVETFTLFPLPNNAVFIEITYIATVKSHDELLISCTQVVAWVKKATLNVTKHVLGPWNPREMSSSTLFPIPKWTPCIFVPVI